MRCSRAALARVKCSDLAIPVWPSKLPVYSTLPLLRHPHTRTSTVLRSRNLILCTSTLPHANPAYWRKLRLCPRCERSIIIVFRARARARACAGRARALTARPPRWISCRERRSAYGAPRSGLYVRESQRRAQWAAQARLVRAHSLSARGGKGNSGGRARQSSRKLTAERKLDRANHARETK